MEIFFLSSITTELLPHVWQHILSHWSIWYSSCTSVLQAAWKWPASNTWDGPTVKTVKTYQKNTARASTTLHILDKNWSPFVAFQQDGRKRVICTAKSVLRGKPKRPDESRDGNLLLNVDASQVLKWNKKSREAAPSQEMKRYNYLFQLRQ